MKPGADSDFAALEKAVAGKDPNSSIGKKHDTMNVGNVDNSLTNFKNDETSLQNALQSHHQGGDQYTEIQNATLDLQHDMSKLHHEHSNLCFLSGTMITTTAGERAVEDLSVGDVAITAFGERKPIAWIGHQDVIFGQEDEKPVCVKANAIADGVPYKDLYTSSAHAYAFTVSARGLFGKTTKDVFVRASALVNGASVVFTNMRRATYWHVELEGGHNILVANGAAAESFADHGERSYFTNATSAKPQSVMADCLPRMKRGRYVRSVRRMINNRHQGFEPCEAKVVNH